ncbi:MULTISPECIES: hypothetical protein [unclassified Geodermatophilus]|uniref:hypothetical protein n=1 Tax=unclassified Geodermatophilus TaxID=2637632 RepID=UPI003EEE0B8B
MHPLGSDPLPAPRVNRTAALRVAAAAVSIEGRSCTCGHGKQAHEHYRRGTDCALCACGRYRRPLLRLFAR